MLVSLQPLPALAVGYTLTFRFPDISVVKNLLSSAGDLGSISGSGRSPGREMATPSSTLAWEIPRTVEPGSHSPWGHRESDVFEHAHTHTHTLSLEVLKMFSWFISWFSCFHGLFHGLFYG